MNAIPEGIAGTGWAFGWGLAAASGALGGALIALVAKLPHRGIAAVVSFGAGLLISIGSISIKIAADALIVSGVILTAGAIIAGAAIFSVANAALAAARDRKRCGDCKKQVSEAETPGSGKTIALATALDAFPKALVLGVTLRVSGQDVALMAAALAVSNAAEALSATLGMRLASRSLGYLAGLWGGCAGNRGHDGGCVLLAYPPGSRRDADGQSGRRRVSHRDGS